MEAQIAALKAQAVAPPAGPLKLDLGCGNATRRTIMSKEKGWTGVDLPGTEGADVHLDLSKDKWPWPDSSVEEVNCSHMLEHIPGKEVDWELRTEPGPGYFVTTGSATPAPKDNFVQKLVKIVSYPRVHFFNELWRVLKPGGKAAIITPHWCSCRAYGDITHEWPPVSEMFWAYLNKEWRNVNAPHSPFICNFDAGYGYLTATWLQAEVANRNPEFVHKKTTEALERYKEAAQDMHATLKAIK